MATDIRAILRYADVSAQKARLVVDMVRGKPALEAVVVGHIRVQIAEKFLHEHVRIVWIADETAVA